MEPSTSAVQCTPEMIVGARSETGKVREENQDRMTRTQVPAGDLYLVADGMGGYEGGSLAAQLTVQTVEEFLRQLPADHPRDQAIVQAIQSANARVHEQANSGDPSTEKMGSTIVLLLVSKGTAWIGHVGDSRAYLFRGGQLKLLTHDHTAIQRMIDACLITEEEAEGHPDASLLSRAVGAKVTVEPEVHGPLQLEIGDGVLLCSDGLSRYVKQDHIVKALNNAGSEQDIARKLVDLALDAGGEDNVTVQFARYAVRPAAVPITDANGARWFPRPAIRSVVAGTAGFALGVFLMTIPGSVASRARRPGPSAHSNSITQAPPNPPAALPPAMDTSSTKLAPAVTGPDQDPSPAARPNDPPKNNPESQVGEVMNLRKQVALLQKQLIAERQKAAGLRKQLQVAIAPVFSPPPEKKNEQPSTAIPATTEPPAGPPKPQSQQQPNE